MPQIPRSRRRFIVTCIDAMGHKRYLADEHYWQWRPLPDTWLFTTRMRATQELELMVKNGLALDAPAPAIEEVDSECFAVVARLLAEPDHE